MTDLLVTIIASLCIQPSGADYNWECVDQINNCAVELKTLITAESIKRCVDKYQGDKNVRFNAVD